MSAAKRPHLSLLFMLLPLVASCDFVGSMTEAQGEAQSTAAALEKELGTKPFVGWNVHNGTLVEVTVIFETSKVANLSVGDLDSQVRKAVAANFRTQPKQIMIAIRAAQ